MATQTPAVVPGEADQTNNQDDDDENEEAISSEHSGFERIGTNFEDLGKLVSEIQTALEISSDDVTSNAVVGAPTALDTTSNTTGNQITEADPTTDNGRATVAASAVAGDTSESAADKNAERRKEKLKKDVKNIRKNVEYIKENVNTLKSSPNSDGAEELLQHLMDAAKHRKAHDFPEDSDNLKHLLHIVAKLKHWIPLQRNVAADEFKKKKSNKKKKESPFVSKEDKENAAADIVKKLVSYDCKDWGMDGLLKSYGELKVRDKLCLLCFSVFLCDVDKVGEKEVLVQKNLVIKKKILIYWWVGEGLIHPNRPSPSPIPNSTTNTDPQNIPTEQNTISITNPSPIPNSSTNADAQDIPTPDIALNSADQYHTAEENRFPDQVWPPREDEGMTIEQIGDEILKVLRMKGFIEPVMKRGRESGYYQMHPFVHSFVTALAKKAGFFDFSKLDGKLTGRFGLSQRACLLKSQGNLPSSCSIWKGVIDNRTELKNFATVQTLFNVNESIIDIKPEWFSQMKYLSVLHLGSWRSEAGEHIEVEDPKFMEELKSMKQLKLFSLQGVATIMKLPDSVCKLSNLIILDLRECHNLEELPANIGELKNLTHLDLTNCHLLTKLPIGISLLSKLEVLHWFVIYNQDGEKEVQKPCLSKAWDSTKGFVVHDLFRRDNKEVCALKDLLKLGSLRELSIVVNRNKFPSEYEVEVLMKMKELCTLKISWVYDIKENDKDEQTIIGDSVAPVKLSSKGGSCFRSKRSEGEVSHRGITQNTQNSECAGFIKLEKLELWCFPGKNPPPDWLVPSKLKELKKLYIKGGNLESLCVDRGRWNVETLRLKYMKKLKIEWRTLIDRFPNMTYLEKFQCPELGLFPCDHEGVWIK